MSLPEFNDADFDRAVLNFSGKVVVLFGEPQWSPPCRSTELALERLSLTHPEVRIVMVKPSDSPNLSVRFRVYAVPTTVIFDVGCEVRRLVGPQSDAVWQAELKGG
jgi:thioredoxin-like negative regulator of GroEL